MPTGMGGICGVAHCGTESTPVEEFESVDIGVGDDEDGSNEDGSNEDGCGEKFKGLHGGVRVLQQV